MLEQRYTYSDYEEAYYHQQWQQCKIIGLVLLHRLNDKYAKELIKKLEKFE